MNALGVCDFLFQNVTLLMVPKKWVCVPFNKQSVCWLCDLQAPQINKLSFYVWFKVNRHVFLIKL